MNGMWSSSRPKGWPRHGFEKRAGAIFFGIVAMFAAWFIEVQYQWDGMQRYYLAHYVVSSAGLFQKYLVLHTVDRRGKWHPTVPAEVVPVKMATYPHGVIPFRLSDAALERGAVRLANPLIPVDKQRFQSFLRDWVYDGRTLTDLAKPGLWWGLGVMVVGLCFAWPQDRKAREVLEHGRRARGAELVTRDEFNRKRKYRVGMGFLTLEPRNLRERMWIKYSHGPMIFIPEEDEPKHFLLMGDTGSGKRPPHDDHMIAVIQRRRPQPDQHLARPRLRIHPFAAPQPFQARAPRLHFVNFHQSVSPLASSLYEIPCARRHFPRPGRTTAGSAPRMNT